MNNKKLTNFLIGEGLICIIIFFLIRDNIIRYDSIISFPFVQIGYLIRTISLSGSLGNAIAWIAYVSFCSSPLILIALRIRKKIHGKEDTLLLLLSTLLFITMYYMINPGLAEGVFAPISLSGVWKMGTSSVVYIVLIGYVIIRILRRLQVRMTDRLLIDLEAMLVIFAAILVMALTFVMPLEIIREMEMVEAPNTMAGIDFSLTHLFTILRKGNKIIPLFYQILIVLAGFDLVQELKVDRYSHEVVEKAVQLGNKCKQAIVVTVTASIVINVLQLMTGAKLIHSDYHLEIPLISVLIVIITMLLAKYFAHSSQIKEDLDLFV